MKNQLYNQQNSDLNKNGIKAITVKRNDTESSLVKNDQYQQYSDYNMNEQNNIDLPRFNCHLDDLTSNN